MLTQCSRTVQNRELKHHSFIIHSKLISTALRRSLLPIQALSNQKPWCGLVRTYHYKEPSCAGTCGNGLQKVAVTLEKASRAEHCLQRDSKSLVRNVAPLVLSIVPSIELIEAEKMNEKIKYIGMLKDVVELFAKNARTRDRVPRIETV